MPDLDEIIELVPEGVTSYQYPCPSCGQKKSFSVSKVEGSAKWNCFRVSCGFKGVKELLPTVETLRLRQEYNPRSGGFTLAGRVVDTTPNEWALPKDVVRGTGCADGFKLLERYSCLGAYKKQLFKCFYDRAEDRLIIGLSDDRGTLVGGVGRVLFPRKGAPKTLNYGFTSIPFRCSIGADTTLIVEDCYSAIAATNHGYNGLALLGTSIKPEHWPYFKGKLVVALDRDARSKQVSLWKQLKQRGYDVSMINLDKDVKDGGLSDIQVINSLNCNRDGGLSAACQVSNPKDSDRDGGLLEVVC